MQCDCRSAGRSRASCCTSVAAYVQSSGERQVGTTQVAHYIRNIIQAYLDGQVLSAVNWVRN